MQSCVMRVIGSERQKKTGAEGDRLSEAKSINQSLSALGTYIIDILLLLHSTSLR